MASTIADSLNVISLTATTFVTAPTFNGNLVGNVTGSVTGAVTGGVTGSVTGTATGVISQLQIMSADGAISILYGSVHVTKGSGAAITLAAPTAGTDDGKILTITADTTFTHVVTSGVDGFNAKGSSGTITMTTKGHSAILEAYNGHWWVKALNGAVVA